MNARELDIVVCGGSSDAHTWNLVYLQLILEDSGHRVRNMGPCVTPDALLRECVHHMPDLIVIGTVNGHGRIDGMRTIAEVRDHPELARTPIVLGGNLGVSGAEDAGAGKELERAGFDAVFHGPGAIPEFRDFVAALPHGAV